MPSDTKLTARQQLTIQNLTESRKKILSANEIVEFCQQKLLQSSESSGRHGPGQRKHSKEYYRQIINHFTKST